MTPGIRRTADNGLGQTGGGIPGSPGRDRRGARKRPYLFSPDAVFSHRGDVPERGSNRVGDLGGLSESWILAREDSIALEAVGLSNLEKSER